MNDNNQRYIDLYGLAYECPFIERKEDCPFKLKDGLSFRERIKWIDGLSKTEKEIIQQHHKNCFNNREFEKNL